LGLSTMTTVVCGFAEKMTGMFVDPGQVCDDYRHVRVYGIGLEISKDGKVALQPSSAVQQDFERFQRDYVKHHGLDANDLEAGLFLVEEPSLEYLFDTADQLNIIYTLQ
jgi:hypothetical protein